MLDSEHFIRLFYPYSSGFEFIFFDTLGLLFLAAFFDFKKPFRLYNLDLLMLAAWIPLGDYEKGYWPFTTAFGYGLLFYFFPRLLLHQVLKDRTEPCFNFSERTYRLLSVALAAYGAFLTFTYPGPHGKMKAHVPFIAGSAAAGQAGARCILQGDVVYGNVDRLAPETDRHYDWAWDAYGPAYYYTFLPFEYLFPTTEHFKFGYGMAARVTTTVMNCGSIVLLNILGRQLQGALAGAALGFSWAVLPYTLIPVFNSKTGDLMPGFLALAALVLFRRSIWAGAFGVAWLGAAALFPVFLIPTWAATLPFRKALGFFALTALLGILLSIPQFLQPNAISIFLDATAGSQERFGDWAWSVWTQYPQMKYLRAFLQLMFLPVALSIAWLARRSGFPGVLAYCGSLVIYIEMFKLYVPGRYHLWYLPFLLPYFLLPGLQGRSAEAPPTSEDSGVHAERIGAGINPTGYSKLAGRVTLPLKN